MPPSTSQDFDRLERPPSLTVRVEQMLRQAIAEGQFVNGKLPTEVELAKQLGVSRETVRLAAENLHAKGCWSRFAARAPSSNRRSCPNASNRPPRPVWATCKPAIPPVPVRKKRSRAWSAP